MKKQNGFTIIELLVTMVVFAIVAGAAVSLFQFQAKSAASSTTRKMAREAVGLALMTIQRDIERAGLGLVQHQPLSITVKNGGAGKPDELYLSFSDHVSMDWSKTNPWSFFDALSSPGQNKLWFALSGGTSITLTDVGAWIGTEGTSPPVGAVIRQQGAAKPDAVDLANFVVGQNSTQQKKNQFTATLTMSSGFSGNVAPAVSYKLIASTDDQNAFPSGKRPQLGTLLRNGMPVKGAGTPIIGAWQGEKPPFVKVTDFQVRCGFRTTSCTFTSYYSDHTQTNCWAPENGKSLGDSGWEVDKLRVIEVTIKYIMKDKAGGAKYPDPNEPSGMKVAGFGIAGDKTYGPWSLGGSQTITVAPRNIVLDQYLGLPK